MNALLVTCVTDTICVICFTCVSCVTCVTLSPVDYNCVICVNFVTCVTWAPFTCIASVTFIIHVTYSTCVPPIPFLLCFQCYLHHLCYLYNVCYLCPLSALCCFCPLWYLCAGVLWLCIVAESLYLTLLFTGGALMAIEQCPCFSIMNKLKLSAFAALCTALSGKTLEMHTHDFLC